MSPFLYYVDISKYMYVVNVLITCRYEIAARDAQAATENSVSVFLVALERLFFVSPFVMLQSDLIVRCCAQDEDDGEDDSDDDDEAEQALPYIPWVIYQIVVFFTFYWLHALDNMLPHD